MSKVKGKFITVLFFVFAVALAVAAAVFFFNAKNKKNFDKIASPSVSSKLFKENRKMIEDADFYISPDGSGTGDGTLEKPFKTISMAKTAVRELIASKKTPKPITVALKAGEYNEADIVFGKEDSGKEGAEITYAAYGDGEVIINGGLTLKGSEFTEVTGEARKRLCKKAAKKVKMLDLSKYQLTPDDYGKIKARGAFSTENHYDNTARTSEGELFFNSARMTLAKYPNDGFLQIGEVLDPGDSKEPVIHGKTDETWVNRKNQRGGTFRLDNKSYRRLKKWKTTEDVWLFGYFYWDWADMSTPIEKTDDKNKSLTTKYCSTYGFKEGGSYYFYNVLEELDSPGEYYIDSNSNILYFYPPEKIKNSQIMLSVTENNIIRVLPEAEYIKFEGLTIKGTRVDAVNIGGNHCSVISCCVKDAAGSGIVVNGCGNLVLGCEVCHVGKDAVSISGGDAKPFTRGENLVDNNSLHDYGEIQRTYIAGVRIKGIGNTASHNEIYNAPHIGIAYSGNENVIEYNHLHDVVLQSSDAGAIYCMRSYKDYGNIARYNLINDIGSGNFTPNGIYFDDNYSGQVTYGNILINIPGNAFLIGGGRDNTIKNNLIINAGTGICYDQRAYDGYHSDGWYKHNCDAPNGRLWLLMKEAQSYNAEIGHRYPAIDKMHQDYSKEADAGFAVNPAGSVVTGNIVINRSGEIGSIGDKVYEYSEVKDNYAFKLRDVDKFFADVKNGDYSFAENCRLIETNPEIAEIDIGKIGRYPSF